MTLQRNAIKTLQPARSSMNREQMCPALRAFVTGTIDAEGFNEAHVPLAKGGRVMDLEIWLPAMFVLGLVGMGFCYAFLIGCEKI
jgi:hypothetical protein